LVILGIDPGTKITGYGIIDNDGSRISSLTYGEIKIKRGESLSGCLRKIYDDLINIIRKFTPNALALEDVFYGKNIKSLIKLGHARGAVILAAIHSDVPVYEYTPLEIKKAVVGYGRAEKHQVQQMVRAILNLDETPASDASDGLAAAICHSNFLKTVSL
jgi:crossover junction endodeoxyribonuclease RuvC